MDIALPTYLYQELSNLINAINTKREKDNKIDINSVSPSKLQKALFDYLVYEYIDPENEVNELNTLAKVFYNVDMRHRGVSREDDPVMSFQSSNELDTLDYTSYDFLTNTLLKEVKRGYTDSYCDYYTKNPPILKTNQALLLYNKALNEGDYTGAVAAQNMIMEYLGKEMFEGVDLAVFPDDIKSDWNTYEKGGESLFNPTKLKDFIDICRKTKENTILSKEFISQLFDKINIETGAFEVDGAINVSATPVVEAKETVVPEQKIINPQQEKEQASEQTAGEENKDKQVITQKQNSESPFDTNFNIPEDDQKSANREITLPIDLYQELSNLIDAINENHEKPDKINIDSVTPRKLHEVAFEYLVRMARSPIEHDIAKQHDFQLLAKVFYYSDDESNAGKINGFNRENLHFEESNDYETSWKNKLVNLKINYNNYYLLNKEEVPDPQNKKEVLDPQKALKDLKNLKLRIRHSGATEERDITLAEEMFIESIARKYGQDPSKKDDKFAEDIRENLEEYKKTEEYTEPRLDMGRSQLEGFLAKCEQIKAQSPDNNAFITNLGNLINLPEAEQASGQTSGENQQSNEKIRDNINNIPLTDLLASNESNNYFKESNFNSGPAKHYRSLKEALTQDNKDINDRSLTVGKALECLKNKIPPGDKSCDPYFAGQALINASKWYYKQHLQNATNFLNTTEAQTAEATNGEVQDYFSEEVDGGDNTTSPTQPSNVVTKQEGDDINTQKPTQKRKIYNLHLQKESEDVMKELSQSQTKNGEQWLRKKKKIEKKIPDIDKKLKGINVGQDTDASNNQPTQEQIYEYFKIREDAKNENTVLRAVQKFASGEEVAKREDDETDLEALRRLARDNCDIPQYNDLDIKDNQGNKNKLTNTFKKLVGEDFDISNVTDAYQLPKENGKDGNLVICYQNKDGKEEWFTNGKARFAVESGEIYQGGPGKLKALEKDKVMDATGKQIEKNNKIIESVDNAFKKWHLDENGNQKENGDVQNNSQLDNGKINLGKQNESEDSSKDVLGSYTNRVINPPDVLIQQKQLSLGG